MFLVLIIDNAVLMLLIWSFIQMTQFDMLGILIDFPLCVVRSNIKCMWYTWSHTVLYNDTREINMVLWCFPFTSKVGILSSDVTVEFLPGPRPESSPTSLSGLESSALRGSRGVGFEMFPNQSLEINLPAGLCHYEFRVCFWWGSWPWNQKMISES